MAYGSTFVDTITSSGNLAINGNIAAIGNLTVSGSISSNLGISYPLTASTAQTASGSSVLFTNIPSWVQRITMTLVGVSAAAGANMLFRIGTGGSLVATGYTTVTTAITNAASPGLSSATDNIGQATLTAAASNGNGTVTIVKQSGNTWVATSSIARTGSETILQLSTGSITLAGTLDTVGVALSASSFDAGSVNILYE